MEETLRQSNRLLKIDRSRKHANEVHVYLASEWGILQSKMSRSIWDLACAVWFSFQVDAFCLARGLHERTDPKYHLNPLLVSLYPVPCEWAPEHNNPHEHMCVRVRPTHINKYIRTYARAHGCIHYRNIECAVVSRRPNHLIGLEQPKRTKTKMRIKRR